MGEDPVGGLPDRVDPHGRPDCMGRGRPAFGPGSQCRILDVELLVLRAGQHAAVSAGIGAEGDGGVGRAHGVTVEAAHWAGRWAGHTRRIGSTFMGTVIGSGVVELDTLLGGWQRVTAGYLMEG